MTLTAYQRWTNLLSGLEQELLEASDQDVLVASEHLTDAKRIVEQALLSSTALEIPMDESERRVLLEIMLGAKSMPSEIRKVYGDVEKLPDSEVLELLHKLLTRKALPKS